MNRDLLLIGALLSSAPALLVAQQEASNVGPQPVASSSTPAAPTTGWNSVTENSVPSVANVPYGITLGSDGAIWFISSFNSGIGRLASDGSVTEYYPASGCCISPNAITSGPDGALWFTDADNGGEIGRLTTDGVITEFPILPGGECCAYPQDITTGPDGALWFIDTEYPIKIGRITTSGVVTEFPASVVSPYYITAGKDGALWFTEPNNSRIGRMTTTGIISEYPLSYSSDPQSIVSGPEGNLWFTEFGSGKIGRITLRGVITEYPLPNPSSDPNGITVGPDQAIWFTEYAANKIGRITADGSITEYALPVNSSSPAGITPGSDHGLWFTQYTTNQIGRAWACGLDMTLAFASSTLDVGFHLGVAAPANFGAALFTDAGIKQLWSFGIAAVTPPAAFTVPWGPGFPGLGNVAVLSTLGVADTGLICAEWQTINTGGTGASVDELRHMIQSSGLLPESATTIH